MGVGRQAPGGQLRDHGARPRLLPGRPPRHRDGRGGRVPRPDAPGRRAWEPWRPGTTTSKSGCCSSWSARRSGSSRSPRAEARALKRDVTKAHTRDNTRVLTKRAAEVDGELRIVADPPLIIPIEDLIDPGSEWEDPAPLIKKLLSTYRRTLGTHSHPLEEYRYVHAAYKMVGVGSVGTRCYIMLMLGRDHNDPLFLQTKEAQASVLERFAAQEHLPPPWPARGGRPAADAGGDRHLPGLDPHQGTRRRDPRLLRAPVPGLEGQRRRRQHARARAPPCTRASAARPSPAPTPAGATGSPSPPTWAGEMPSTGRSPTSPPPTPTRTKRTTRHSPRP